MNAAVVRAAITPAASENVRRAARKMGERIMCLNTLM
jgi:hypothetical protein